MQQLTMTRILEHGYVRFFFSFDGGDGQVGIFFFLFNGRGKLVFFEDEQYSYCS